MTDCFTCEFIISTAAQCQFSPLHFKFHESRALFCSLFSGIPRRSIKEWMKCQLQMTVEKIFFRRLNSTSMISNKDSEFSQRSVLFESHHFNKNFTCTGLPSLQKPPSCSKSVFYIPQAYTQTPAVAVFHVLPLQSSNPRGENIVWMEDKDLLEKSDNDTPHGSFPGFFPSWFKTSKTRSNNPTGLHLHHYLFRKCAMSKARWGGHPQPFPIVINNRAVWAALAARGWPGNRPLLPLWDQACLIALRPHVIEP